MTTSCNYQHNDKQTPVDFMELSENSTKTKDNKHKLVQHHYHYDLRKFNFTNWMIPTWNSLCNHVVSADTVNTLNK